MKRLALFAAGLLALVVIAAPPMTIDQTARWVKGGLYIGSSSASALDKNRINSTITVDVDYDFASATIVCNDTPAQTATGVRKGDPCFVGIGPRDGGVQVTTANSVFDCYSDADDTAKLRHCAVGTAANPADAGYVLRFIR